MRKVAKCPKDDSHTSFKTTAHEVHDWIVDARGEFIDDLGCTSVSRNPDTDNEWVCNTCFEPAIFVEVED